MKTCSSLVLVALFMAALMLVIAGCEFNATQPLWYQPAPATGTVTITGIDPAEATPGENYITIYGTNLDGAIDSLAILNENTNVDTTLIYRGVYFGNVLADVAEYSSTSIKVRRPNLESDSCIVKIASNNALVVAKYATPYKIDGVLQRYGLFTENMELAALTADKDENLYVVTSGNKYIYKITPSGDKTKIATAVRVPYDATFGPDGRLYLAGNNRDISVLNLETGEVALWLKLPSGKVVKFGDFGANGYFYTGGNKTDLVVVSPSLETATAGFYANDEILAVRVYNGYVYVASRPTATTNPAKIWKHALAADGSVGSRELVLDMSTAGGFSSRVIKSFAISSEGRMFLATDSENPILSVDLTTSQVDIFYKGIVPAYCKQMSWGSGNYIYLISGDTDAGQEWTVYRVDMGETGALHQ